LTASPYVECSMPKHVSTDHDPLFRFHRWLANLRVLEIDEIKSVPYVPVSHPFVERLIGTIRRAPRSGIFLERGRSGAQAGGSSEIIPTGNAFIARSPAPRRRSALTHSAPLPLHWITTVGSSAARVCFRSRSLPDYDFATDRSSFTQDCSCVSTLPTTFSSARYWPPRTPGNSPRAPGVSRDAAPSLSWEGFEPLTFGL